MKLTQRQTRIVAALYHQAQLSYRQLARQLGYQEHTVRREVELLRAEGIIRKQAFIDIYRLGYIQYELYLSLGAQRSSAVDRFIKFLFESSQVAWIGQYSGAFQYVLTVCARSPYQMQDFINQMGNKAGVAITDRQMSIRLAYTEFAIRYLGVDRLGPPSLSFGRPGTEKLDELDHRILRGLTITGELSLAQLASKLHIPHSTCHARIKQLESKKIIAGYSYVVDFSKLGIQAFSLLLKTRSHSKDVTSRLLSFCENQTSVAHMSENIGAFDYKLGIHLLDPSKIVPLTQRLGDSLGEELVQCACLTAFDYLKVSRYPFEQLED